MVNQNYNLNLVPSGSIVVVHCTQYDDGGRIIEFSIFNGPVSFDLGAGITAKVNGTKPDNTAFTHDVSIVNNKVVVTLTEQMTIKAGRTYCNITLTDSNNKVVGSAPFILDVSANGILDTATESESEFPDWKKAIEAYDKVESVAQEAATSAANAKVSEDKAKTYMEEAKQTDVSTLATEVDEIDNGLNSLFRYYKGVDLTQKFASEIANYSDEWAWIKARIQAGNFKGIYVCDYIPITCSNGYVLNAQVAGINTYKGYGNPEVGNHIDFICKELWGNVHVMNKVNYNNGNANSPSPFLASDLNYWLNSMSGNVPNSTSDPSVTTEVDYTTSGVLYYLPDKLKNQIITKRILLPSRYTEGKVITNDNSWAWQSTGKLWIPSEIEVCGAPCWGNSGYGMGGFAQYPLFDCIMNRAKLRCAIKDRCGWWLLSAYAGASTPFALVSADGYCGNITATSTWVAAPVCFRI